MHRTLQTLASTPTPAPWEAGGAPLEPSAPLDGPASEGDGPTSGGVATDGPASGTDGPAGGMLQGQLSVATLRAVAALPPAWTLRTRRGPYHQP